MFRRNEMKSSHAAPVESLECRTLFSGGLSVAGIDTSPTLRLPVTGVAGIDTSPNVTLVAGIDTSPTIRLIAGIDTSPV